MGLLISENLTQSIYKHQLNSNDKNIRKGGSEYRYSLGKYRLFIDKKQIVIALQLLVSNYNFIVTYT